MDKTITVGQNHTNEEKKNSPIFSLMKFEHPVYRR